ncbi:MAG TPA: hypothetical protein VFL36_12635 [Myxococcales bacterium]|nr:hypothetical protein [Myxococcales bacterium]
MGYKFRFYRMGGLDQVAVETGEDLAHLHELDQKLWVALSCPVKGLEISERTLSLLDLDGDGRVRVPEVLAALRWCGERLRDLGSLIPGADGLALADVDDGKPAGKALLGAIRHVLAQRGKPDAAQISVADVADVSRVFDGTRFNGDGVVVPASADDAETQAAIADAVSCVGGVPDRSGALGIDRAKLAAFFADLAAYAEWAKSGEANAQIAAGYESVQAVRVKVDDWFNRCRIAEFDARLLAPPEPALPQPDLQTLPIARVEPGAALPLVERVNPAWSGALATFQKVAVAPLLGAEKTEITAIEWEQMRPRFTAMETWLAAKKGASVEKLGLQRVEALLQGGARARIEALLAQDEAFTAEANAVGDAVRLVHYKRDLHTLLKNFVSFHDFYDMQSEAVFQAGTLYLDSRSCNLCVRVDDMGAHATLASLSRMYIAYCDLKRPGQAMKIAACFTQGDSDYLMQGRNGLFYDRQGRDWDATIVRIIENPISIRQAFFAPYKKALRMIEEQVQKFAEAREKESEARLRAATAAGVAPEPAKPAVDVGKMVGIVAALGVGVGAIGTLFGGFVAGFMALQPWYAKPVALLGAMLAISGPSMLLAWLKLRQRTLGPVLEGNGWAVNGRVRVNIPLGAALTDLKSLPPGSTRSLDDPFEDKRARRRRRLLWFAAIALGAAGLAAKILHLWPFGGR